MTAKLNEASDRVCRAVQKIRGAVDSSTRDALHNLGYGTSFVPDGRPLSERLISECESDAHEVERLVNTYLTSETRKIERLENLAERFEALVASLGEGVES